MSGKNLVGTVLSISGRKSCVVQIRRVVFNQRVMIYTKQRTKVMAHDENEICQVGDVVGFEHSRRYSAKKRHLITHMIHKHPMWKVYDELEAEANLTDEEKAAKMEEAKAVAQKEADARFISEAEEKARLEEIIEKKRQEGTLKPSEDPGKEEVFKI